MVVFQDDFEHRFAHSWNELTEFNGQRTTVNGEIKRWFVLDGAVNLVDDGRVLRDLNGRVPLVDPGGPDNLQHFQISLPFRQ